MILLLAPGGGPRLAYAADLVFRQRLGTDYRITADIAYFLSAGGLRLNYSDRPLEGIPRISPSGLLSESGIRRFTPATGRWDSLPVLFPSSEADLLVPFDILSAVFWMLTRYEEYLPFEADTHGRFPATAGLAFREGFLRSAVVDHWIARLGERLLPGRKPLQAFTFQPTLDIDVAFAYRHKGFVRNLGGWLKDLSAGRLAACCLRLSTLLRLSGDPYDTYEFILNIHRQFGLRPVFFFLCGDRGPNDKNIPWQGKAFRQLVKRLSETGGTGLHPSYASSEDPARLKEEAGRLCSILGQPVNRSRQHFLLLRLPGTYRRLLAAGITDDYTLGFADQPGFRAGTSLPFFWYDLEKEEQTALTVHPFTVMDGTLRDYLGLTPGQAMETIDALLREVKQTNGTFISLWHNESLGEHGRWKGWLAVYKHLLENALT